MNVTNILSCDPEIVHGAVVFKDTRVPVETLFGNLVRGMSLDEFIENFPTVEKVQAETALLLACDRLVLEISDSPVARSQLNFSAPNAD